MKNTFFFFLAAVLLSATAGAQSTVDSIRSKYQLLPMPDALTVEKTFPVIGTYQLTGAGEATSTLTVSLDSANKGIIWVDGLPQGRVKAYLKQSPATYRILSQKSASGQAVPEGTLYFDPSTSTLQVALGKAFDDANPTEVFAALNAAAGAEATGAEGAEVKVKTKTAKSKSKTKLTFFSATKVEQNTTAAPFNQQLEQQQQQQQQQ
jgi:hypothetical protein